MPQKLTHENFPLVQVMAWCHQATCHYLSKCWHRYMLPYGITRPQWVTVHLHRFASTSVIICPYPLSKLHGLHQRDGCGDVGGRRCRREYHQTSDISHTLVGNKLVDHSDIVRASPVGAAPTTSLQSRLNTWLQYIERRQLQDETRIL